MRIFNIAALAAMLAAVPTSAVLAADIEAEMDKWVFTPCLLMGAALSITEWDDAELASTTSLDDIMAFTLLMDPGSVNAGKDALRPLVRDAPWNQRKVMYKSSLKACINGAMQR